MQGKIKKFISNIQSTITIDIRLTALLLITIFGLWSLYKGSLELEEGFNFSSQASSIVSSIEQEKRLDEAIAAKNQEIEKLKNSIKQYEQSNHELQMKKSKHEEELSAQVELLNRQSETNKGLLSAIQT